ncbi:MAG: hypothetical protein VXW22_05635 [Pseudomonadota bacterium]|nr:hypothetical protein [Pseudomonadota bacterium]
MARPIPTDETLLATIYKRNLKAFSEWTEDNKTRVTKIWVPIDIDELGKKFRCDPDLIFGRLYYHMNEKYGSSTGDGQEVNFFNMRLANDRHVVNFPLLTSVLADLQDNRKRFIISTRLAALSLVVSAISIGIAVLS